MSVDFLWSDIGLVPRPHLHKWKFLSSKKFQLFRFCSKCGKIEFFSMYRDWEGWKYVGRGAVDLARLIQHIQEKDDK